MVTITRKPCIEWEKDDPILGKDEIGYDTIHNRVKIGDGVHNWSEIPFIDTIVDIDELTMSVGSLTDRIDNVVIALDDFVPVGEFNELSDVIRGSSVNTGLIKDVSSHTNSIHDIYCILDGLENRIKTLEERLDNLNVYNKVEVDAKIKDLVEIISELEKRIPPLNNKEERPFPPINWA